MIFSKTTAIGLIFGSTLGLTAGLGVAHADDVIVPGSFVVAEIPQQEPQPTIAPLPPSRSIAFTQRQVRPATSVRTASAPRIERVAEAEPRRRVEANLWPMSIRPNFMWIGTVY